MNNDTVEGFNLYIIALNLLKKYCICNVIEV